VLLVLWERNVRSGRCKALFWRCDGRCWRGERKLRRGAIEGGVAIDVCGARGPQSPGEGEEEEGGGEEGRRRERGAGAKRRGLYGRTSTHRPTNNIIGIIIGPFIATTSARAPSHSTPRTNAEERELFPPLLPTSSLPRRRHSPHPRLPASARIRAHQHTDAGACAVRARALLARPSLPPSPRRRALPPPARARDAAPSLSLPQPPKQAGGGGTI
jgi:hypothetical protein